MNARSDVLDEYTTDVLLDENIKFSELHLRPEVITGLNSCYFHNLSPVQLKAIPIGICGLDIIVQAKSGTGKTCVFCTIVLDSLVEDNNNIQALILSPTREIAAQSCKVMRNIGCNINKLGCHLFTGGVRVKENIHDLESCHIALGTPGRVKQLIEQKHMDVSAVKMFVLDEADKLLEGNFQTDINWIFSSLPYNKQIMALSATYPKELASYLKRYMRSPTFVRLNPSDPALLGIRQFYDCVREVGNEAKYSCLYAILKSVYFQQVIVFSNDFKNAERLSRNLTELGFPSRHIGGAMEQRHRTSAIEALYRLDCRVLVTTDLTSRGIDSSHVNLVINLDLPPDSETYLHRIGRAGRYGRYGAAISIVNDTEMESLNNIEMLCNTKINKLEYPLAEDLAKSSGCKGGGSVQVLVEPSVRPEPSVKPEPPAAKSQDRSARTPRDLVNEVTRSTISDHGDCVATRDTDQIDTGSFSYRNRDHKEHTTSSPPRQSPPTSPTHRRKQKFIVTDDPDEEIVIRYSDYRTQVDTVDTSTSGDDGTGDDLEVITEEDEEGEEKEEDKENDMEKKEEKEEENEMEKEEKEEDNDDMHGLDNHDEEKNADSSDSPADLSDSDSSITSFHNRTNFSEQVMNNMKSSSKHHHHHLHRGGESVRPTPPISFDLLIESYELGREPSTDSKPEKA